MNRRLFRRASSTVLLVAVVLCHARPAAATDFYVAPDGLPTNSGAIDHPLDLATALSATSPAQPGDTIWLRGGVYTGTFISVLQGTQQLPITVRQYPGERATLDGAGSRAAVISAFGAWTVFWGFELTNSHPERLSSLPGFPENLPRGYGIWAEGPHLKFINLVFHNLAIGIGVWEDIPGASLDTEIYGSLFYYNGWEGPDRQHGHGIYTQNRLNGQRLLRENILFSQFSHGIHAFGSASAFVDNVTLEGNVAFNNGILGSGGFEREILVSGGERTQNPVLHQNYTYGGTHARLDGGLGCTNAVVTDNYFVGRDPFLMSACTPVMTGNTLYGYLAGILGYDTLPDLFPQNTYHLQRPTTNFIAVRPNIYEPGRGHVVVYNWEGQSVVAVDLAPVGLSIGAGYEIRDAQNFFGPPVAAGQYDGSAVLLPMAGLTAEVPIGNVPVVPDHTGPEFGVFVVLPSDSGLVIGPPLVVATPTISPTGGTFDDFALVEIATATPGAEIRYTTNGNAPTSTSTLYTGPFQVSQSSTVKARGFAPNMLFSVDASAGFTIILPQVPTPTISPAGGSFGGPVTVTLSLPTAASQEQQVKSFALNGYKRELDGQWQGIRYASDGNVYFGSSTHSAHHGAAFFKYDPRTDQVTLLAEDITTLLGEDPQTNPQGAIHSDIVEANGWLYMAPYFSSEMAGAGQYAHYSGTHLIGYELATGAFRDYGVIHPNYISYSAVGVDPVRNYVYMFVTGMNATDVSYLYRIHTVTGEKTNLGQVAINWGASFWMFVDQRGDVWFSIQNQNGALRRVIGATGEIRVYPNALPPMYRWDSEQLVPSGDQAYRWIMWMQPLDGDRAVFTLGWNGGMLYTFDSSKPIGSGQEFQAIKHIGFSDLGLATDGNRVFYYQRANRGFSQQEAQDFHLLSVALDPGTGYPITDHGLVKDQDGRLAWRLPGMATDGQRVFIIGDLWTLPGDLGTLRYRYNGGNEFYEQLNRGQFFMVAEVDSVETPITEIRYTTDGREPTSTSRLYTGPFSVSVNGTVVRARGFAAGAEASPELTAGFTIATPPSPPWPALGTRRIAAFDNPVHVTGAGDGSGRLFVVELSGKIWIVQNGIVRPTPFIDIFSKLDCGDGRLRLLSLAFPPGFGVAKQHFYLKYLDKSCNIVIARYRTTADPNIADPNSEQIVLSKFVGDGLFGGPIYFGPDGYLYVALGDGSHSDTDNNNNAQASGQILGKVLRIDVETDITGTYTSPTTNPFIHPNDGIRDEIWAEGLRNPWRFTFDRATGDVYIADVGSQSYEEINFQPASSTGGENYGWKVLEGFHCFGAANCNTGGFTPPVMEYNHSVGCSVTGGVVYRGVGLTGLHGIYLYGDLCSGIISGLRRVNGTWQTAPLASTEHGTGANHSSGLGIVSFGEDDDGNVYMLDYGHEHDGGAWDNGGLYLIELASPSNTAPLATFSAAPASITPGQAASLSWSTSMAVTVTIDQAIGAVAVSGTLAVSPAATTVYTLTATGINGLITTESVTVTVVPPAPSSLAASPQSASEILLGWDFPSAMAQQFTIERCQASGCSNFVEIDQVAGDVTAFSDSGVLAGTTYRYRVRAHHDGNPSAYSNVANAITPPAATTLTATIGSSTTIALTWADVTGEIAFLVERCAGSGCTNFSQISQLGANVTSFTNASLTPGVAYRYRLRATNAGGSSAYSNIADATTLPPHATGLVVTVLSDTALKLDWADVSTAETGYRIERCMGTGCTTFASVGQEGANVVTRSDSGLTPATLYRYRVVAFNAGGDAVPSTIAEKLTLPAAPINLLATSASPTQINLTWADGAGESGYLIERCTAAGCTAFTQIAVVGADATTFANTNLISATTYRYRMRAYNASGSSSYSDIGETVTATAPPPAPGSLLATVTSSTEILVRWTDTSAVETGFEIERCQGAGCTLFVPLTTVGVNVVTISDTGLSPATLYRYRVRAVNAGGPSVASNIAETTTPPPAPGALTATVASATQVNLSWSAAPGGLGVLIERCGGPACANFTLIAQLPESAISFANTGLAVGTLYRYRVRAFNAGGNSGYSVIAEALTLPSTPSGLTATTVSTTQVQLRWIDTTGETEFRVERCAGVGCTNFAPVAGSPVAFNVISLLDTSAQGATRYRYRVYAFNAGGLSAVSNIAEATTLPNAPANPVAATASASQINLTWDADPAASGVRIERCLNSACTNFVHIAQVGPGVNSYPNGGLSPGTLYRYRAQAFNAGGNSAYSTIVEATTPPSAPLALTATPVSATQVQLRWADTIGETEFRVERCVGVACTNFTPVAGSPVALNVIGLLDTSAQSATRYRYRVFAFNPAGLSAASNIAETTTLPNAAANPVATPASASQINLTWGADPAASGVRIERCHLSGCTTFTYIGQVGPGITAYASGGLSPGTLYRYRLQAFNAGGNSAYSTIVEATTPPSAPVGLTATIVSATQVQLRWNDTTGETEFRVERCAGAGCTNFAPVAGSPVAFNVIGLLDTSTQSATRYRYRVYAFNAGGLSAVSNIAEATTAPNAPANPVATSVSASQINLTWDADPAATGVRIERCHLSGCTTFTYIGQVGPGITAYPNGALPGTLYRYRLQAFNAGGNSAYSAIMEATTPPSAPAGLTATPVSATQVQLLWIDTAGETEFRVERCAGAGCTNFAPVAGSPVALNVVNLLDTSAQSATRYRYRVFAFNAGGLSVASNIAEATTVPNAPANPVATSVSASQINLTWGADLAATGVRIERCHLSGCTTFTYIGQVGPGITAYANGVLPGTLYRYRLQAFNAGGNSAYSAITEATTPPPAPGAAVATANSATQITVRWTDPSIGETGFRIERCTGAACTTFVEVGQVNANVVTFVDGSLLPSTIYRYQVKGFNAGGNSVPSGIGQATTQP